MKLAPGDKLGQYEILAIIGADGMGEVYRARDTRLKRDVALKVLPTAFAGNPERMARFQREAEMLAALNHPGIAAIYGVEQQALVMELVEGEPLSTRIKAGPVPVPTALLYAKQIAEALEAAHEKGITHRDLKPLNVMVTPDGAIKVLDFGLAKTNDESAAASDDPEMSPTVTLGHTDAGVILGTAGYMSPEQAHGKPADRRADVWSFGVVFYEMLSGKRAFTGESASDTLASVLKLDPDWNALPPDTPPAIRKLIRRCLNKDRKQRLQAIGDARITIDEVLSGAAPDDVPAGERPAAKQVHARWPWVAAAAVVAVGLAGGAVWVLKPAPEQRMFQMEITPPDGVKFVDSITPFALSPDGRKLAALGAGKDGKHMLWLRSIDSESAAPLAGTEGAEVPFWSPDSRWLGFSANGKLQKLDVVSGGAQPQVICEIEGRAGGTWSKDGVILFDQGGKAIQRVSASGGTPISVFPLDASHGEVTHLAPYFLPDGQHFLYYSTGRQLDSKFASLDGKVNRVVLADVAVPTFAPNPRGGGGWLMYNLRGQLMARPFDPEKGEFTGQAAAIADGVGQSRWWYASTNGLLAFRHSFGTQLQFTWFGRDGGSLGTLGDPGDLNTPRISPDEKSIVFTRMSEQNLDIWTFDLARKNALRFTFEPGPDGYPIWSPDSKNIVYASFRNSSALVVERPASGVGPEAVVTRTAGDPWYPSSESRDGRWLVFTETSPVHSIIALLSREDPNKVVRIQEREAERDPSISPDGRWLLYSSIPASSREVLVRSMPKEAGGSASAVGKWQISTGGGSQPMWRADGKEIFFWRATA